MPIENPMLKGKVKQSKEATPTPTHAPDCPKCASHRHIVNLAGEAHFYCGNCGYTTKTTQQSLEDNDAVHDAYPMIHDGK
jgi:transposase-like protein